MEWNWIHTGPTMLAAFLASLVEFVEALTVILAVGIIRGWRSALGGAGLALATLVAMIALLGPALTRIRLDIVHLVMGALLLLFGLRWLRKAILRAAAIIPLHDEEAAFARQRDAMGNDADIKSRWDYMAISAAFKITMIEGIEVVFIVIAIGATGNGLLGAASIGALAALVFVAGLGVILHRPVAMIPENKLKFIVGILISAFGTFWVGEGMGLAWPGDDLALVALMLGYLVVALSAVPLCRARAVGRL
ncbi:MAG: hypothetical protein WCD70_15545 [Alphaproteobacteria bacterium]